MQGLMRSALASLLLTSGACIAHSASAISTPEREGYLPGWSGVRIHYRVLGSGPDTIVAVHGGPGAGMHAILPELRPLAGTQTVIFYDQRGGGYSELPSDTTLLGATEHVQDLEAVRRFFKLEKLTLVAHSFGSVLVARYAQDFPDRIERMVFFGAVGPRRAEAAQQARAPAMAADSALQARWLAAMRSLMGGSAADPVVACREYEAVGRQMAVALGESGNWQGTTCAMPPEAVRYYYRYTARLGPQDFGDWDFSHSLRHVEAPLLVIAGDQDPGSFNVQRAWAAALPLGRLFAIPGAGKTASADRPDLFFPAVETFLAGRWPANAETTATLLPGSNPR